MFRDYYTKIRCHGNHGDEPFSNYLILEYSQYNISTIFKNNETLQFDRAKTDCLEIMKGCYGNEYLRDYEESHEIHGGKARVPVL